MPMVVRDQGDPNRTVNQPLVPGLAVAYAIDNDRTISYLSQQRLAKWGKDMDDLHEIALENLHFSAARR